ncbi:hypothetical protein V8F33_006684 [Rhypophila sp. PSN 637]
MTATSWLEISAHTYPDMQATTTICIPHLMNTERMTLCVANGAASPAQSNFNTSFTTGHSQRNHTRLAGFDPCSYDDHSFSFLTGGNLTVAPRLRSITSEKVMIIRLQWMSGGHACPLPSFGNRFLGWKSGTSPANTLLNVPQIKQAPQVGIRSRRPTSVLKSQLAPSSTSLATSPSTLNPFQLPTNKQNAAHQHHLPPRPRGRWNRLHRLSPWRSTLRFSQQRRLPL